ncbi:MAG: pyridoxal-phosphate dependent enzyme [Myxococcales bacterium]|nr:pyridoxal-phosphate dependent enzyme [Myxococcales bacterium]MCB9629029.1 pyridoxal-phosphate dependent enzyme [Sandaracinaceae bacterium]
MTDTLGARFPGLASMARADLLGPLPTPVEPLVRLSRMTSTELFIKRDDRSAQHYGGNKARKLAFLLGDAQRAGADTLLTVGAFGSHHVLATSVHGARNGFAVHGVLVPQPFTPHVERNLLAGLGAGATHHPVRYAALAPAEILRVMARLRLSRRRPYFIPHGGTSALGALGYVDAGLELGAQIDARFVPEPHAVYTALGSGGTAVGLAVGLAAAGLRVPVIAARVTPTLVAPRPLLDGLVEKVVHELHSRDPRFPRVADAAKQLIVITDESRGAGYGEPDEAAQRAAELALADDIELDPTYTAKAFAEMLRHAEGERRGQRLIFVHTLSSQDLTPLTSRAPALPRWTDRYRRELR